MLIKFMNQLQNISLTQNTIDIMIIWVYVYDALVNGIMNHDSGS